MVAFGATLMTGPRRWGFGVGASCLFEEWDVMELPFGRRGRVVDECIEVMQRLFTEDEIIAKV